MLRQHHGLSKIPTKVQEVSEKTELRGLLETEIWPNPGQCSSGAKPHLPSHPHSSPGDAWMSPGWKRVQPGCLIFMCGHSAGAGERGSKPTHLYGSVCVSPGRPPSRTGHRTDRRRRLWRPLKERGGGYSFPSGIPSGGGVLGPHHAGGPGAGVTPVTCPGESKAPAAGPAQPSFTMEPPPT